MILPFQAASAVFPDGLYGIALEENSFYEIDSSDGTIVGGDFRGLGPTILPSDPNPTTDYGGTAMSVHSDGRFFCITF